ncbi:hypothetical protein TNCV_2409801 [Trichonephila clavipes]|nr:hypothetical protein TNCV_2409801 [Trichonephila clavipes]
MDFTRMMGHLTLFPPKIRHDFTPSPPSPSLRACAIQQLLLFDPTSFEKKTHKKCLHYPRKEQLLSSSTHYVTRLPLQKRASVKVLRNEIAQLLTPRLVPAETQSRHVFDPQEPRRQGGKDCEKCGQGQDAGVGGCLGRKVMADAAENESPLFLPPGPLFQERFFDLSENGVFLSAQRGGFRK